MIVGLENQIQMYLIKTKEPIIIPKSCGISCST